MVLFQTHRLIDSTYIKDASYFHECYIYIYSWFKVPFSQKRSRNGWVELAWTMYTRLRICSQNLAIFFGWHGTFTSYIYTVDQVPYCCFDDLPPIQRCHQSYAVANHSGTSRTLLDFLPLSYKGQDWLILQHCPWIQLVCTNEGVNKLSILSNFGPIFSGHGSARSPKSGRGQGVFACNIFI